MKHLNQIHLFFFHMDFSAKNQLKWIVCVCEYTCVCLCVCVTWMFSVKTNSFFNPKKINVISECFMGSHEWKAPRLSQAATFRRGGNAV